MLYVSRTEEGGTNCSWCLIYTDKNELFFACNKQFIFIVLQLLNKNTDKNVTRRKIVLVIEMSFKRRRKNAIVKQKYEFLLMCYLYNKIVSPTHPKLFFVLFLFGKV